MYSGKLAYKAGNLTYGSIGTFRHDFDAEFEATPDTFTVDAGKDIQRKFRGDCLRGSEKLQHPGNSGEVLLWWSMAARWRSFFMSRHCLRD